MSRTREQLRRRRWLRQIWLAVLAAAVAALCAGAGLYASRLDAEARQSLAVAETIRYWDLTSLEAAMGPPPEEGPRLYAAHMEADRP